MWSPNLIFGKFKQRGPQQMGSVVAVKVIASCMRRQVGHPYPPPPVIMFQWGDSVKAFMMRLSSPALEATSSLASSWEKLWQCPHSSKRGHSGATGGPNWIRIPRGKYGTLYNARTPSLQPPPTHKPSLLAARIL